MDKSASWPVIIGVGQVTRHWAVGEEEQAPTPTTLCAEAMQLALADTQCQNEVKSAIDVLAVVRTNLDSVKGVKAPFGRCQNPPGTIADKLGLSVERAIYSGVGGDQPQSLVNEFAAEIYEGRSKVVALVGAEAIAAMKAALKKRSKLDWSESLDGDFEDRGLGESLLTDYERKNGLGYPTQTYPAFENAYRARLGLSQSDYLKRMSDVLALFSDVAKDNEYAQFPGDRTSEFLSTPSKENYRIADPYLKWHVAQDAVNQGAAVILTSAGQARSMGIAEDRMIWLHGHAQTKDKPVLEREDFSRSKAIELTIRRTLESSGVESSAIDHFDIYSCFPVVIELAAETLGVDPTVQSLTVTGGLPFFGGAGNNYSMHAIASMVERLREANGSEYGLVLANGGFMSKEAAGLYSNTPPQTWTAVDCSDIQHEIDSAPSPKILNVSCDGEIETYTVTHGRHAPSRGYVIAKTEHGRVLARAHTNHRNTLTSLSEGDDPIGQSITIRHEKGSNFFLPSERVGETGQGGFLSRDYRYVKAVRNGHVLEVTLNRPKSMNSLHSAAHFELTEIWDEYERDEDLWVAILTGEGERAFCSGNDLKATAKGGDMSLPKSGFAGLCNRFDRTKPIICAVNGVAMGGGLEIVLACDLAIADPNARFALPEVKVGLFAAAGGVQRLTRQIGRKAAMELILTGRHFTAEEALELGVINQISPDGQSLEVARQMADRIQEASPSAVRATKLALNALEAAESLDEALKANGPIFGRLMRTKDFSEGVTAFAEKRTPVWTNS